MYRSYLPRFKNECSAISPLIGVILMLFLTILFAGITVSVVYGDGFASSLGKAPMAVIELESIDGGVPTKIRYEENYIVLLHMGGDELHINSTRIVLAGQGSAFTGFIGHGGITRYGEVFINYNDLSLVDKESTYSLNNPDLSDGLWSVGERITLNGADGIRYNSSVSVRIGAFEETANNYGLKEDATVNVKIIDKSTDLLIAECSAFVTSAA